MKLGAAFPEIIYSFFLFSSFSRFVRKASYITSYITPAGSRARQKPPRGSPPVPAQVQPFSSRYMHDHARSRSARGNARDRWNSFLADNTRVWQFRCFIFSSSLFFCRLVPTIWERRRRRLISGRLLASRQLPLEYRWGFSLPCLFAMRSACYIIRCRAHVCAVLSCK